jgi:hypothetical protein
MLTLATIKWTLIVLVFAVMQNRTRFGPTAAAFSNMAK